MIWKFKQIGLNSKICKDLEYMIIINKLKIVNI